MSDLLLSASTWRRPPGLRCDTRSGLGTDRQPGHHRLGTCRHRRGVRRASSLMVGRRGTARGSPETAVRCDEAGASGTPRWAPVTAATTPCPESNCRGTQTARAVGDGCRHRIAGEVLGVEDHDAARLCGRVVTIRWHSRTTGTRWKRLPVCGDGPPAELESAVAILISAVVARSVLQARPGAFRPRYWRISSEQHLAPPPALRSSDRSTGTGR
jgi:hypothetical protein